MNTADIRYETVFEDNCVYHRYVRVLEGVDADDKPTLHEFPAPWMRSQIMAQFEFVKQFPGYAVRTIFGPGDHVWSVTHTSPDVRK